MRHRIQTESKEKISGCNKENRTLENGLNMKSCTCSGQCKLFCWYFIFPSYLCADKAQSASKDRLLQEHDITVRQSPKT